MCDFADDLLPLHKKELNSLYPSVDIHTRQFDAGDEASVKKVVEEALQNYGRLDVFFANAGISSGKIFTETSSDEFMRMMRTNTLRYARRETCEHVQITNTIKTASSSQQNTPQKP